MNSKKKGNYKEVTKREEEEAHSVNQEFPSLFNFAKKNAHESEASQLAMASWIPRLSSHGDIQVGHLAHQPLAEE